MADGRFSSLTAALKELGQSKELTRVDLTNVDVRDAGVSDLMLGLRKQRQLTELNLSNCGLGKSAAGHLATFLKYNKTVTRLYLQHNKRLEDEGLKELTKGLVSNSTLKVLNLANCNIGDDGITVLTANCGAVNKLYLYNNRIQEDGAAAIANMIREKPSMIELFLWDNQLGTCGLETIRMAHGELRREADKKSLFGPRLNLVIGLGNEKVEKTAAPTVQRNFVLPSEESQH